MNLFFVSAEMAPFTPSTPVADAVDGLSGALRERGHSVAVVLPLHRALAQGLTGLSPTDLTLTAPLGDGEMSARIWQGESARGVTLWLVERDEFFDRSYLYGTETGDYTDNASRYIFFSKIAVELAKHMQPIPEVLHAFDWPAALVPVLARAHALPFRAVLSIIELAKQGSFWSMDFGLTNLPGEYFSPGGVEFFGRMNLLKGGIVLANQVVLPGEGLVETVQSEPFGEGLEAVFRANDFKLAGVLPGVDASAWDPASDRLLAKNYGAKDLDGKEACRDALLKETGLKAGKEPVIALTSPLTTEGGMDVVVALAEEWMENGLRLLIEGRGETFYERYFQDLAEEHPEQIAVHFKDDDTRFRRLVAGADFLLAPAKGQAPLRSLLQAMRYGTPVIATADRPQAHLVQDNTNGLLAERADAPALRDALQRARKLLAKPKDIAAMRRAAMAHDVTWDAAALRYETIYAHAQTTLPQQRRV